MDRVKADNLLEKLKCCTIGPWKIVNYRNHGKSAAVFRATDGNRTAALKIFDDELIARYGNTTQLARIDRELTLIGKQHPNMVTILDGGYDKITENHYIVMEYLDGPNIKECLRQIPPDQIPHLIEQLARAAQYLEGHELVHRDIKPENIALLDNYKRLVLLDFGVLRPIGKPGLTDDQGIQNFVGTLQYSSPEFLLREEQDTEEGWRSLTFYQIGAVLHDMIMQRELFSEFAVPFSRLVNAVQNQAPLIQSSAVDPRLITLARSCLLKDPVKRLEILDWNSFSVPSKTLIASSSAKMRVTNRATIREAEGSKGFVNSEVSEKQAVNELVEFIKEAVRRIEQDNKAFPRVDVIYRKKHENTVVVRLRQSEAYELPIALTIGVTAVVIEASVRAAALTAIAHWGREPKTASPKTEPFFKGVFDTTVMGLALEERLYELVDMAQHSALPADGNWIGNDQGVGA